MAGCDVLYFDPTQVDQASRNPAGHPVGPACDGWQPCTAPGQIWTDPDLVLRWVCTRHRRQLVALHAAGLADQVRWQRPGPGHRPPSRPGGDTMTPTQARLYLALHRLMDDLGFRVHDCTGPGKPLGGVCLVPNTPGGGYPEGIVVCWTPHDRLSRDADGPDPARDRLYHTLQEVMNDDLAFLLETAGCTLQPFGQAGATLVTATPPAPASARRPRTPPTVDR